MSAELAPPKPEPDAAIAAAIGLHRAGRAAEAEAAYRKILNTHPDHAGVLHNLAILAVEARQRIAALALFDRALECDPDYAQAHLNRGGLLQEMGRLDAALESYRRVRVLDPAGAEAPARCGDIARRRGDAPAAIPEYLAALARNDGHYRARFGLALAHAALGHYREAMAGFAWTASWRRDRAAADPCPTATAPRLLHDRDQLRRLAETGVEAKNFTALARACEGVAKEIGPGQVALDDGQRRRLAGSYNLPLHIADAPALRGPAINPALEIDAIMEDYRRNAPGVAWFDNLLTPGAMTALRQYLLDGTIWYDHGHIDGFLAAFLENGLASPLLLQIAGELRGALPEIFRDHLLSQAWAFKCLTGNRGIGAHADAAAVSVNFWITPDDANLDPGQGGLVVYKTPPPADWRLTGYDSDIAPIGRFLVAHGGDREVAPYRENRAVIFNSDLFHESAAVAFKPGYENHRINVTLLFGDRVDG